MKVLMNSTGATANEIHVSFPVGYNQSISVSNYLLKDKFKEYLTKIFDGSLIDATQIELIWPIMVDTFNGGSELLEKMSKERPISFSKIDKTNPTSISKIHKRLLKYFDPEFISRISNMLLPTMPLTGPMEILFCLATDYKKVPKGTSGDLIGINGFTEIKGPQGRLGGNAVQRNGCESKTEFARLLGCKEDSLKKWGKKSYGFYQEEISKILDFNPDHLVELIDSLMQYSLPVDKSMIRSFEKNAGQHLSEFHCALHLHCYAASHNFAELIFVHSNGDKVVSYQGSSFGDAYKFSNRYLTNKGGWGSTNQDRSGLQVVFDRD